MIVVVGSLNYDLTVCAPRFPQPGETVLGDNFRTTPGGKGANQAYTIAKMGTPVKILGCVGADAFGDASLDSLRRVGVDVSLVLQRETTPTGVAVILLDASGQNEIVVAPGANTTLTAEEIRSAAPSLRTARAVVTQLETTPEATQAALALARAMGVLSVLNPAPAQPVGDEVIALCDFLIPNESEASQLSGLAVRDLPSAEQAAAVLRGRGARNVIVTLGANGAWVETEAWRGHIPAFSVPAVDTVAAGDVFIGAFVVRLLEGAPMPEAVRFGCAAAAIAVSRPGSQPSVPTRAEVDAFLAERGYK
ncbi:MAG: ribokinase [Anaerolineae bacterium]|nr:ribokinase [Anaerolineae bacterium]